MRALVMVDAENCGLVFNTDEVLATYPVLRRRELILDLIRDTAAALTGIAGSEVELHLHWADPRGGGRPQQQSRMLINLAERAGYSCTIHQRVSGKGTTDIGLAVAATAAAMQAADLEQVTLAAGDADYVPLIDWLQRRGAVVSLILVSPGVYGPAKEAVRRAGGRVKDILKDLHRRTGADDPLVTMPMLVEDRIGLLRDVEEMAAGHPERLAPLLKDRLGHYGADALLKALLYAGPLSPLGNLLSPGPTDGSALQDRVVDWLSEAELVWVSAVLRAHAAREPDPAWALQALLLPGFDDPRLLAAARARARIALAEPPYIRVARLRSRSAPADRGTRLELLNAILRDSGAAGRLTMKCRGALGKALRMAAACSADPTLELLDCAWIAAVAAVSPEQERGALLAPGGPIHTDFYDDLAGGASAGILSRIGELLRAEAAAVQEPEED